MRSIRTYLYLFALSVLLVSCHSKRELTKTDTKDSSAKYAALLGVSETDFKNKKLAGFLDQWYGTPYKYGGSEKSGIDCSHLSSKIMQEVYGKKISGTAGDMQKVSEHISEGKLKEGDLIFFKIESKNVSHVGVYITNHRFVHASSKRGVMISDLNEPYFKKYYYTAGRIN